MIITLVGADFSASNINAYLTSWSISAQVGTGATYSGPTSIAKDAEDTSLSATVTIAEGYSIGSAGVTVTMSGVTQSDAATVSEDGMTVTISIASVTGNVVIKVPTVNSSTGEEDGGNEEDGENGGSSGTVVELTQANATFTTTEYHLGTQSVGSALVTSTQGTKGVLGWDIPANALVTITTQSGGTYGMALTDTNDIVLEGTTNNGSTYTFSPIAQAGKLYMSTTKFTAASYVILSEEELAEYEFNVTIESTSDAGYYISASQTVGSAVQLAEMGGVTYKISNTIPANTITTLTVVSGGNYGMCIADENGLVLESKPSGTATDNVIVFSKQTVPYKLWVSTTKFTKATYKYS